MGHRVDFLEVIMRAGGGGGSAHPTCIRGGNERRPGGPVCLCTCKNGVHPRGCGPRRGR